MQLELCKQYPFNFVAIAFKLLGYELDNPALAKFDACKVDAFLQDRSVKEKEVVEWVLTSDDTPPPSECYGRTFLLVARCFRKRCLDGDFGLVSLADFNGLAMSWAAVEKVVNKIDRLKDEHAAQRCLYDVRDILAAQVLNAKFYGKLNVADFDGADEILVRNFAMDSYGRQLLLENNLNTAAKLSCVTADYLLSIRDFGEKRLERVRECLKTYGVHLLGES